MKTLLVATKNPGKIREIRYILSGKPFRILTLSSLSIDISVQETGKTYEQNAAIKAKGYGGKANVLTLAEDSGLEVDALEGRPGIMSSRYVQGSDMDRINKLLGELKEVSEKRRTARYRSAVAIYDPAKKTITTYEGVSEGYIVWKPLGNRGFGYDPIFYNIDLGKTNAQATEDEKNRVSHRARALMNAIGDMLK